MKKLLTILLFLTTLFTFSVQAKVSTHQSIAEGGYNFWVATPNDEEVTDTMNSKPLVIFLHGASLCGRDLNKVKRYGTINAVEKGRKIDAYVVAPQNPGGAWKPSKVMEIVEWMEAHHKIDSNRIYVLGMSLGGYGTMDVAAAYPNRIAAAIAMCGGSTAKNLGALNEVPLWIIHGTADRAVPVSQSDRVAAALRAVGGERLVFDRIPGMNHSQPARVFYLADTYDWLMSHSLSDPGRKLNKSFALSSDVMKNAYKDLNHSRSYGSSKKSITKSGETARRKSTKKTRRG